MPHRPPHTLAVSSGESLKLPGGREMHLKVVSPPSTPHHSTLGEWVQDVYPSIPQWRWIGFSTHLSVFFVLMRGEYDPLLKWPFESKVSLVLVDQNMHQHIVETFKPLPESSSFQRPKSDINVASGCPHFAKLSVLDEGNCIKNVLYLKCIIYTSKVIYP